MWGGIWGSNPRHPEPQSGALPTELIPPFLARQEGFEPPTYCLEGSCSILLSYWRRSQLKRVERVMGIEPTYPAWKAGVLPLNYTRTAKAFQPENDTTRADRCQSFFLTSFFARNIAEHFRFVLKYKQTITGFRAAFKDKLGPERQRRAAVLAKTQWYREMAVYQIWTRSFCDGNGDSIGDLYGVLQIGRTHV